MPLRDVTLLRRFIERSSDNDRRKSLQPRSFPLMRRKTKEIITKEERKNKERRVVGIKFK